MPHLSHDRQEGEMSGGGHLTVGDGDVPYAALDDSMFGMRMVKLMNDDLTIRGLLAPCLECSISGATKSNMTEQGRRLNLKPNKDVWQEGDGTAMALEL